MPATVTPTYTDIPPGAPPFEKAYARPGRGDRRKNRLSLMTAMYFDIERLRLSQAIRLTHLKLDKSPFADDPMFAAVEARLVAAQDELDVPIQEMVKGHECWTDFNLCVKGVGPHLLGLVMGLIRDVTPLTTVSKLWWLCGLAVVDGKALRPVKGQVLNYDARLKSVLLGRLGGQLLRNADPFAVHLYERYYPEEEAKLKAQGVATKTQPATYNKDKSLKKAAYQFYPGAHRRALRKVVKLWVACLWETWRQAEGLSVGNPYPQPILGHIPELKVTPAMWVEYNRQANAARKPVVVPEGEEERPESLE